MADKVFELIKSEKKRQTETLQMIPSENYVSRDVRMALGSELTNKYSEGYAGKRYYQGNKYIDEIEILATDRAKKLFGVSHVNVQPYSGSPANAAATMAVVEPGETIMGLKLSGGGHLTHGHPKITFSGKFFRSVQYDVDENGLIDYDVVAQVAKSEKPKLMILGTTAYPRILDFKRFGQIADEVGAWFLADISHIAGLVVGGVHPSPVADAHLVMTTTHKTLRGPRGAMIMVTQKGLDRDPELAKNVDRAVFPGLQGGPHDNVTAGIAIALGEAESGSFRRYAKLIVGNAAVLAEQLKSEGLILTTGGTDNHLLVVDLQTIGIDGKTAAVALEEAGIVVNANSVPHDPNPPARPSGIRLGTPAITTRGMKENEMKKIGKWISQVVKNPEGEKLKKMIAREVKELCGKFPL